MPRTSIETESFRHANPIPAASRIGPLLVSSIIGPRDPGGDRMPDDVEGQLSNLFHHVGAMLEAAGADWRHVAKMTDYEHASVLLHALARTPAVPIVRVPWNEQGIIGRVLDAGAMGVIIPMVNSVEEARRAVAACRYAPKGARSFGPLSAGARYGGGYYANADDLVACIPMIETRQAVE